MKHLHSFVTVLFVLFASCSSCDATDSELDTPEVLTQQLGAKIESLRDEIDAYNLEKEKLSGSMKALKISYYDLSTRKDNPLEGDKDDEELQEIFALQSSLIQYEEHIWDSLTQLNEFRQELFSKEVCLDDVFTERLESLILISRKIIVNLPECPCALEYNSFNKDTEKFYKNALQFFAYFPLANINDHWAVRLRIAYEIYNQSGSEDLSKEWSLIRGKYFDGRPMTKPQNSWLSADNVGMALVTFGMFLFLMGYI